MEKLKLQYAEQDGDLRWVTITTLLLAIGVILRMVSPNIGGISLNWNIVMYCTAIMLCRPTAKQGLGIGTVSGLIATMTSKAALPYANLVSDPVAGLVCAYLARQRFCNIHIKGRSIEPLILVFVTTFISGGLFVTITKVLLGIPLNMYLYAMLPTVVLVAAFGMVVGQLLYEPANKIFNAGSNGIQAKFSLHNINLTVNKGEFAVITGVNGAGKTTLLFAIAGARAKYFGGLCDSQVIVNGIDILTSERSRLNQLCGFVMADYEGQLVTETVGDEIAFSLENMGLSQNEIITKRAEVLRMVGLNGFEERKITSLSGGQKQRLAIAAVLVTEPAVILLDEPVAAIDPEGAQEIYDLLKQLHDNYGKTIIVAEHDLKYVMDIADTLTVLDAGTLKYRGAVDDCLNYIYENRVYAEVLPLKWKIRREMRECQC